MYSDEMTFLLSSLLVIGAAAIIHAMMQLGVSVLTLMSGHSLGARKAHSRLLRLNIGYIIGTGAMTFSIISAGMVISDSLLQATPPQALFAGLAILSILSSLSVLRFYYRRSPGTLLWIPRGLAEYLTKRAKTTKSSFEAVALGAMTAVMELPFTVAPIAIISVLMIFTSPSTRLAVILGYCLVTVLPLVIITGMIGAGHKLSTIQRWREDNKKFLQYASSFGLLAASLYIVLFFVRESV